MIQVAVLPIKPKDIYNFLERLLQELRTLESAGLKVKCPDGIFEMKVHLLLTSGDIVGVQELIHHTGHQSKYGCRICHIASISATGPAGKGKGRYYPGARELDEERPGDEFKYGAMVRRSRFCNAAIV